MTDLPYSNPTTSYAAALSMEPHAPTIRERVYHFIADGEPCTADAIEMVTGLSGNTVRPRLVELYRAGRIETAGYARTRSGRLAQTWRTLRATKEAGDGPL